MSIKDDLYRLVDVLPESELNAARRYLEYLRDLGDPVLRALREAPQDDEPETKDEQSAVAEAYEDLAARRIVTTDTIWNEIS